MKMLLEIILKQNVETVEDLFNTFALSGQHEAWQLGRKLLKCWRNLIEIKIEIKILNFSRGLKTNIKRGI